MTTAITERQEFLEALAAAGINSIYTLFTTLENLDEDGEYITTLDLQDFWDVSGHIGSYVGQYFAEYGELLNNGDMSITIEGFIDGGDNYIEQYSPFETAGSGLSFATTTDSNIVEISMASSEKSNFTDKYGSISDISEITDGIADLMEGLTADMLASTIEPMYKTNVISYTTVPIGAASIFSSEEASQAGSTAASTIVSTMGGTSGY